MINVAYVCADAGVPVYGSKGCSIHVQEIVRGFLRRGDRVELFAAKVGGDAPSDVHGHRLHAFPIGNTQETHEREMQQWSNAYRIAQAVDGMSIDLVYERYSLWSDASICLARDRRIPSILEVNAPLIEEQKEHRTLVHEKEAESIRDQVFEAASTIVAVSEAVAKYVRSHLPPDHHAKVVVVPNGVDVDRFAPSFRNKAEGSPYVIGFLGTLKPWHGLESLLSAFERVHSVLPTARLRLIGEGPLRQIIERQIACDNPPWKEQIEWTGAVHPALVPEQLAAFDVAVAPYPPSDAFYFSPLKIFEYMAMGCAVVASDIGQIREILQDRIHGRLYPAGDDQALASILLELERDVPQRRMLASNARAKAVSHHSWHQALETILRSARVLPSPCVGPHFREESAARLECDSAARVLKK